VLKKVNNYAPIDKLSRCISQLMMISQLIIFFSFTITGLKLQG